MQFLNVKETMPHFSILKMKIIQDFNYVTDLWHIFTQQLQLLQYLAHMGVFQNLFLEAHLKSDLHY